jgi:hypothetical protein
MIQGVHPRVVMELLGHSQIAVTMRYSHVVPALREEAADQMDAILQTSERLLPILPKRVPIDCNLLILWSRRRGLNPRPSDYKS